MSTHSWQQVLEVPLGTYVELSGVLRAQRPHVSPSTGASVVGFHVLCSLFTKSTMLGVPEFSHRHDLARWSDAVLQEPGGEGAMSVALSEGPVKAPAAYEDTLSEERMVALLERLEVPSDGVVQIQVLERAIPDGATVCVRGVVSDIAPAGPAFRSSAQARRGLVGARGRPLVIR